MGYEDDMMRSGQRRSRGKQSGEKARGRNIDYKVGEEPGRSEPGLDLITEHFQTAEHRRSGEQSHEKRGSRGKTQERRSRKKSDQVAAARENMDRAQTKTNIYRDPKKRKRDKRKKKIRIILLEVVVLVAVLLFAGYSYVTSQLDMMTKLPWDPERIKNPEISTEKQEQMEGYWTIAVFGVDSRNSSVGSGNNSDVNMICNIDQGTGEIRLVSVYRDSYLNINEKNSYNKINAAYLQGGPEQAVAALNKNLDLDIDDYATFNWKAVADAINILGGIDLEISKAEFYYINAFITETVKATGVGSVQLTHAGMNHLDGVQAVAYGRLRLMDSDYARTERQRKVISLAFEKVKKADWNTLNCIIQTVFPQVSTSVDMADLLSMGRNVTRYHLTETMGFPAERLEVNMGKKGACVVPNTLTSNVTELHRFLFGDENYIPTEQVQNISRKIMEDVGQKKSEKPAVTEAEMEAAAETTGSGEESSSESEESGTQEGKPGEETGEGEAGNGNVETDSAGNIFLPPGSIRPETTASPEEGSEEIIRPGMTESGRETEEQTKEEKPTTGSEEKLPGSSKPQEESPGASQEVHPGTSQGEVRPGSETGTGVILRPGSGVTTELESGAAPGTIKEENRWE